MIKAVKYLSCQMATVLTTVTNDWLYFQDFVTTSLDQKADASDLRALLSKDELDSTAQSIINQLQVFSL